MKSFPTTVDVRRSSRRRRTIAGRIEDDHIIVMIPSGLSPDVENKAIRDMVEKLRKQFFRKVAREKMSEEELLALLHRLDRHYCQGKAQPRKASWSRTPQGRWGSCTIHQRHILLHPMLLTMPRYVLEYVAVHELCHLTISGGHTPEFWHAVAAYPHADKAQGYLEAAARYGQNLGDDTISTTT